MAHMGMWESPCATLESHELVEPLYTSMPI